MNYQDKSKDELLIELQKLNLEIESLKAAFSKDNIKRELTEDALGNISLPHGSILAAVPEIIMAFDTNNTYTWANRHGLDFFGKDVIGKEVSFYFEDKENIYSMVQPLLDGNDDIYYLENWQRRSDGEKRLLAWRCQILKDSKGNVTGAISSARDFTESKNVYEAMDKELNMLHTLIDTVPDRIYAKDSHGMFIFCNKALVKRMGKSDRDEIIGKTDFDLVQPDLAELYYASEQEIIRSGQALINHEEPMGNISGTIRWNLLTKVPLRDNQGKIIGVIGVGKDITDRKLAQEEITLKNEMLQTINDEKDKFFSILAHDLRSPLSSFLGLTQFLTEEIQNMTLDRIKKIVISMKDSAFNIYGLLENLLEWSRLKRGIMDFNPEKVNVKEISMECIEALTESANKKEIKISYSFPDDLEIFADSHMLQSIIRNLISNAIKFTPKTGEISVSAASKPDNAIEFKIQDSGIGMNKELIDKLFVLNAKTNRKGTEGESSTGLGLLLCKEFIDKHNGNILVESKEGKGSVFSFTIPWSDK